MSINQGQQPLELELPLKSTKKRKGYYIPRDIIKYIKDESDRLTTEENIVSENDVLTAIVRCYQKTANIEGEGGPAYDVVKGPKE
mgnify:CR=1 FL=1